jgi:hypothetical protein
VRGHNYSVFLSDQSHGVIAAKIYVYSQIGFEHITIEMLDIVNKVYLSKMNCRKDFKYTFCRGVDKFHIRIL